MELDAAVPALPVRSVVAAQAFYVEALGFTANWHHAEGRIGAVSHGRCALFLREVDGPFTPGVVWIFAEDVDAAHAAMVAAKPTALQNMPYGLRQFTVTDPDGNQLHIHHDL
ncbi:glyoxalase superfamily protein [Vannielia litorea]|uniref:glyoxalase superfamily protein n=1 Tax=Vannielia litorea TaxID=1217970 RepID=UPI001C967752|nr:glyoxalase superfamily protein [Vannielia litorea]MBY6046784.1 VOC family protein [Vannielia litorea]MBY6074198.1 VOC family protein [Vannielia litorea]